MPVRDFLIFRLSGPMSAYGKIAVGEWRDIWTEPSKSGVMGVVAASLGLERDALDQHRALNEGLGYGVRIDAPGRPLRDYHTAQAPMGKKGWRTRKEELSEKENLNTVLSERFYRVEASATAVIWQKHANGPRLETLCAALKRPSFAPYLGRKSCPMGEPTRPEIVSQEGLLSALNAYDLIRAPEDRDLRSVARFHPAPPNDERQMVWFEMDAGLVEEEALADLIRERRDAPGERLARRFHDRREGRLIWERSAKADVDLLQGLVL
jgi:CRISPR system Cascade subunit CasD